MSNIIFDWDGTIAKPEVAHEAATRRFKTLGEHIDAKWLREALKKDDHYKLNRELISKYTGINDEKELTTIMTDLFRFHYTAVVHEWNEKTLYDGMREVIETLAKQKNKLVIASTLRQDLLEYSLKNLGLFECFEKIYGNTPDLKYSKEQLVKMALKKLGTAHYMVGDKNEDILAGNVIKAKSVYVMWGVGGKPSPKEATIVVNSPKELLKMLK